MPEPDSIVWQPVKEKERSAAAAKTGVDRKIDICQDRLLLISALRANGGSASPRTIAVRRWET